MKMAMIYTFILMNLFFLVHTRYNEIIAWDQFVSTTPFHHKLNMFFYKAVSASNNVNTNNPINVVYSWKYAEKRIISPASVVSSNRNNDINNSRFSRYLFNVDRTHMYNYVIWNDDNLSPNAVSLSCSGSLATRQLNIQFNVKFFPCINDALQYYNSIDSTNANKTPKILFNIDGTINSQSSGWKRVMMNINKDSDAVPVAKIGDILLGEDSSIEALCP